MWTFLSSSLPKPPPPGLSPATGEPEKSTATTHRHHHHHRIRTLSKSGRLEEALSLLQSPSAPDPGTYSLLLHACITRRSLQHGESIHRHLLSNHPHLLRRATIKAKLITMYSVCGQIDAALRVFDGGGGPGDGLPRSAWVSMSIAYSRNGFIREALLLYVEMLHRSIAPDNFAFSSALKCCADLSELASGRAVHTQIVKSKEKPDLVLNNALLALYVRCGCLEDACRVFEGMPERNVVSWNSFITGFSRGDRILESVEMFRKMQSERMVGFTWVTLTTVLSVCAHLAALTSGKEIHGKIIKAASKPDILVMNSLMDMYAKCGEVECCWRVFDLMGERDLTSWNTMLTGYALNGSTEDALDLFDQMVDRGIRPDDVSFIALLSGCSHGGFVEEGCKLFDRMEMDFGVSPKIDHYACLVDLLGRAQRLKEALDVVKKMPMTPSSNIWGSLLNSCRLHSDIELGKIAAERLFELEPNNASNYVMLSNMYASLKMWEEAEDVRATMGERGLAKETGRSWIWVGNKYHTFLAGGSVGFCNSADYKRVWKDLMDGMRANGYAPDTVVVLHNIDDEMKAEWIDRHSERIALVYGLIHSGKGTVIRIMKNLRVCVDCHNAMKIISRITKRLIVLRDTKRFHHFHNGACSCRDFW